MDKPRILICGGFARDNYERCWLDWLTTHNTPSTGFDYLANLGWYTKFPHVYRFLWHFGRNLLAFVLNRALMEKVRTYCPDLILVVSGRLIKRSTLEEIHINSKSVIFHYYGEYLGNPLNTTRYILEAANAYDMWFTANHLNLPILYRLGVTFAQQVPFGYNPECHHPVTITPEQKKEYGSDVVFVGTWEQPRAQIMESLKGIDLRIWGGQWEKLPGDSWLRRVVKGRAVYCEEMAQVFQTSKICLSFLRKANQDSHTIRTFEIPACGGFQLSERTEEILGFFTEGKEIACFSSEEELRDKTAFYLSHETLRRQIAESGLRRIHNSPYSYYDRLNMILDHYQPN